jgi:choline dehydrogenase-like flavoprotein
VVIGAGAVGIVLAVALARRGLPVLLCESGGRTAEQGAQALNDAVVSGRAHAGITEGRARVLGGTTTLWGGQLIAFRDIDFAPRPWLGLAGWPFGRETLAPYYRLVESMLGLPLRSDDDDAVWKALGVSPPDLGCNIEFVLTRWLKEANLARLFARDLIENPNLSVLLHASATGFAARDGHITGVTLRAPNGREIEVEADQYVVACGTIEASRLMLAAARERPDLPWADNQCVGMYFQDHLDLRVASVHPLDKERFHDAFDNIFLGGYKYNPKLALSPHFQAAKGITNIAGVFTFESSFTEHLSNLKIFLRAMRNGAVPPNLKGLPHHFAALGKLWWPLIVRYLRDHRAFNPADLGIGLRLHCEQKPIPDSRITLDPVRTDVNGVPLAVLDWRLDGCELAAMSRFVEVLAPVLHRAGLARLEVDPRLATGDPALLAHARDTNHHCGGLRMSKSSADGVVDSDLRVHGTENLFVAGAAVYPSSSFANPTFTAMALGLRLADRLGT